MRALIGVLCAALLVAVPASAASQFRGADVHPQGSDDSAFLIRQEFRMLESAGADSVRFDIAWSSVEPAGPERYDSSVLAWIDRVMREARKYRLRVILDLLSTPCWASSDPAVTLAVACLSAQQRAAAARYPPRRAADYARFVALAASRWRRYLAAVELWNEPNEEQFFASRNPARSYAALVRAAYPAVKRVAPRLPVLISMAGADTSFLRRLYGYGVRGNYDAIAVHPYYEPTFAQLRAFRSYERSKGDSSPLWVTEVGWSSSSVGLSVQARDVRSALWQLAALRYVAAVEIYDMRDSGTDPTDADEHFGLVDSDLSPKPSWHAFGRALHRLARAAGG